MQTWHLIKLTFLKINFKKTISTYQNDVNKDNELMQLHKVKAGSPYKIIYTKSHKT
jgi:hypothetical protein